MRRSVTILIAATLAVALASCAPTRPRERLVRRFFAALNDKDVNRLLTCVDPRQERLYRAAFRVVEKTTGLPVTDILEMLPGLAQLVGNDAPEDVHYSRLRVISDHASHDSAVVTISVRAVYRRERNDHAVDEKIDFLMERFDKAGWRIVGARPAR